MDIVGALIVVFSSISSILLACLVYLIIRVRRDSERARLNEQKSGELVRKLHREYEKIKGPEWAANTIKGIIRDVVAGNVESTRIYRKA